ncbi:MAG: phenylalanine--tRNA ligase subunit beta, partial [Bacteroidota bacterium]|nr:phenylalanine--tRNA ligase subunit beta [Bacteroidota bacterium]
AGAGKYREEEMLALYFTGRGKEVTWRGPKGTHDIYFMKGVCNSVFILAGLKKFQIIPAHNNEMKETFTGIYEGIVLSEGGTVSTALLEKLSIKQPVFYLAVNWQKLMALTEKNSISFVEIPKFPQVNRDLSIVVDKQVPYQSIEDSIASLKLSKLIDIKLFDVFESEKLGEARKSLAITFTFSDSEKTLTDIEVDSFMNRIIDIVEKENNAEIRRNTLQ